jgi:ribosomal protein L9
VNRKTLWSAAICALFAARAGAQVAPAPKVTSDADKLEASAEHLARMKTALKHVLTRVEEARNEKDVVKLNCVNEKLTQIKALLKVAEQADISLHEAIATRDAAAESEFAKVGIARTKVDGLRGQADQCIGQLAYVVDEKTTVEVQQPSDLAEGGGEMEGRPTRTGRGRGPPFSVPPVVRPPPASPSGP